MNVSAVLLKTVENIANLTDSFRYLHSIQHTLQNPRWLTDGLVPASLHNAVDMITYSN
jgi:hypothetical protein